jgi:hypothetical protein
MKTQLLTLALSLVASLYIQAQNPNLIWAKQFKGNSTYEQNVKKIATDSIGNVYSIGYFAGINTTTMDADPGISVYNVSHIGNNADNDIFISKLDSAGNIVWAYALGASNNDIGSGIVYKNGNVYLTGTFNGTVDFDPSAATTNLTAVGGENSFVLKLSAAGVFVWAKSIGGGANAARAIDVDATNNVYIGGTFVNTVDFNPDAGTNNLTSGGVFDAYILKLNSVGAYVFAYKIGGTLINDEIQSISVVNTTLVLGGYYIGTNVDLNPTAGTALYTSSNSGNNYSTFIVSLSTAGAFNWVSSIDVNFSTHTDVSVSVTQNSSNDVYVGGNFGSSNCDFDPSASSLNLNAGLGSIYTLKLTSARALVWAKNYGGPGGPLDNNMYDIALDANNDVYGAGFFNGAFDFDPNAGVQTLTSSARAGYINKLNGSTGAYVWAKQFDGVGFDYANSVCITNNGYVLSAGSFTYPADFDPNAGTYTLSGIGNNPHIFIHKMGACTTISPTLTSYTNPTCNTCANGKATLNVAGTSTPLTYEWQPANLGSNAPTALTATTYTCTITSASTCLVQQTATLTAPIAPPNLGTNISTTCVGTAIKLTASNNHCYQGASNTSIKLNNLSLPTNGAYTLAAWIKPTTLNQGGIIGWGNYGSGNKTNQLRLDNGGGANGQLINYWWGNDFIVPLGSINLLDGAWHHVAVTHATDDTSRMYVDGTLLAKMKRTGHNVTLTSNATIGTSNGNGTIDHFIGGIDEVQIWNIALTPAELNTYKNGVYCATPAGLVGNYHLDEAQGTATLNAVTNTYAATNNETALYARTIGVPALNINYNLTNYTWASNVGTLYTNASLTTPYTAGTQADSLWLRATTATSAQVIATSGNAASCVLTDTVLVNFAAPTTITGTNVTTCVGVSINLNNYIVGTTNAALTQWRTPSINASNLASSNITVAGNATYFAIDSLNAYCKDTAMVNITVKTPIAVPTTQTIIYVKKGANGNGTSWANAMGEVGDALHTAYSSAGNTINQIWVAQGTYLPIYSASLDACPLDNSGKTFLLKSGIKLFGGFVGNETLVSQANPTLNVTTLSGDFNNNDVVSNAGTSNLTITNIAENAYHVVISANCNNQTELNGFTIKGGNAKGGGANYYIGASYIVAEYGGGFYNIDASTQVNNCVIVNNTAQVKGAGIYNENVNSTFTNCAINFNTLVNASTTILGGGVFQANSNCSYAGTTIRGNVLLAAGIYYDYGAGICIIGGTANVSNCIISSNGFKYSNSDNRGAIFTDNTYLTINKTVFDSNGTNCTDGGAIYLNGTYPVSVTNCIFNNNNASNRGGAILSNIPFNAFFINNTFVNNNANVSGGGFSSNVFSTSINLQNNIFYNNTKGGSISATSADFEATSVITINNNQTQVNIAGVNTNTYNPFFINYSNPIGADGIWMTADDGLQLDCGSPCINTGYNTNAPLDDILNNSRIGLGLRDRGAYENLGLITVPATQTIIYVKKGGAGLGNGSNWANAMAEVGHALNTCYNSPSNTVNQIWVAQGTYTPLFTPSFSICPTPTDLRDRTFLLKTGVKLYGGFAGIITDTAIAQANPTLNATILSGDFNNNDIVSNIGTVNYTIYNNTENAYHVIISAGSNNATELNGFNIKSGNANGIGNITVNTYTIERYRGGGFNSSYANNQVSKCIFSTNSSSDYGAGVFNFLSNISFNKCSFVSNLLKNNNGNLRGAGVGQYFGTCSYTLSNFENNASINLSPGISNYGVGLALYFGTSTISNCLFKNNGFNSPNSNEGAAIYDDNGYLNISKTIFENNGLNVNVGGALRIREGRVSNVNNCIFIGNSSTNIGGAIFTNHIGNGDIINNTFVNNAALSNGGGISISNGGGLNNLQNNIFYNNTQGGSATVAGADIDGTPTKAINNQTQVFTGGADNIAGNPMFVNSASPIGADSTWLTPDDGLQLTCASPCVNTGNNTNVATTDALNNSRIDGFAVDKGPYEKTNGADIYSNVSIVHCANTPINLNSYLQVGMLEGTLTWHIGTKNGLLVSNPNSVSPTVNTTYVAVDAPTTACVDSAVVRVIMKDAPQINLGADVALCANTNAVQLIAKDTLTNTAYTGTETSGTHVKLNNANLPKNNSSYTLMAWIKPTTLNAGGIVGWGDYGSVNKTNQLRLDGNNIMNYWWGNDMVAVIPTTPAIIGNWHHVAATYDSTNNQQKLYWDGVQIGTTKNPSTGHNVTNTANAWIGTNNNDNTNERFNGSIDEVQIWKKPLTTIELQTAMRGLYCTTDANLVGNYHFDEGTGINTENTAISMQYATSSYTPFVWGTGVTKLDSNYSTSTTWSPATNLYTNAAHTIAYVAGTKKDTVYAFATIPTIVNVTATSNALANCCNAGSDVKQITFNGINVTSSQNNVTCNGGNNGSATIVPSGGLAPYNYAWSPSVGTSATAASLAVGTYNCLITDANSCTINKVINITQPSIITYNQNITLCAGSSITVGTQTYNTSGTYTDVLLAINGCDSTVTTILNIKPTKAFTQNVSLCTGNSLTVGTQTYTTSGTYTDVLLAANGCDSTVTTILIIKPTKAVTQNVSLCAGSSITVGTHSYNANGTYTDVLLAANGCDSIVTTILIIKPTKTVTQNVSLCSGSSITVGTHTYTTSGTYTDVLLATNGCDSTVTTILIIKPTQAFTQNVSLCSGSSITVGTQTYTTSGTYTDVLLATNGCDSTVTTILIIKPTKTVTQNVSLCSGSSITVGTHSYTNSGTYTDVLLANNGCDSTVTTVLIIKPTQAATQNVSLCAGSSITVGTHTYTTSGTYTDVLLATNGCDSTVTTILIIKPTKTVTQNVSLCAGSSITVGTHTYNASGTYTDVLLAANGCDSTVTTVLIINALPILTSNISSVDSLCITTNSVVLTAIPTGGVWSGLGVLGGNNYVPSLAGIGLHAVAYTYTDTNNCSSALTDSILVYNCTVGNSVISYSASHIITISPNPNNGMFTISTNAIGTYALLNELGQTVYTFNTTSANSTSTLITNLPSGIYVLKANNNGSSTQHKIIVTN